MNPALIITVVGPLLGAIGWFSDLWWLFWIGVAVCVVTLVLNLTSGVMKLPLFPAVFAIVGAIALQPWYVGAGAGIVVWTALESVGEVIGLKKEGRL